ncbi:hypothetical protein BSKO_10795 [Bryopsis sp. KO-2023]|nr:hypothetical protein BSKO_10795 [Bryopsis sp. KO-2023]
METETATAEGGPSQQVPVLHSRPFMPLAYPCLQRKKRVLNDNVHGHFTLSDCCFGFIDTEAFQRLRRLHQLGKANVVYPTATHSRAEHSFGVALLGRKFSKKLLKLEGEEDVPRLSKIVELGGLLHDVGHGPFSHVFENMVLPKLNLDFDWTHEDMSLKIIDWMVDTYNIDLTNYGLKASDLGLIKSLIAGTKPSPEMTSEPSYLWDLVANHRDSLDVDKFDYLQRDSKQCHVNLTADFGRLPYFMKVFDNKVCYDLKEEKQVFNVFQDRARMHSTVYQHRRVKAAELMVSDALAAVSPELDLLERIQNPFDYITLDDGIERECFKMDPAKPNVLRAQKIMRDLEARKLYKLAKEVVVPIDVTKMPSWKGPTAEDITPYQSTDGLVNLVPNDIRVAITHIHYGQGGDNPMRHVCFYGSENDIESYSYTRSAREQEMYTLPYGELRVGVYAADPSPSHQRAASDAFQGWLTENSPPRIE